MRYALVFLALCGCRAEPAPPVAPVQGPTAVGMAAPSAHHGAWPALRWTWPDHQMYLALTPEGKIEGPCGELGTVAATELAVGGSRYPLSEITRTGRVYGHAALSVGLEILAGGDAVGIRRGDQAPGERSPAGHVTGIDAPGGDDAFRALVAASMIYKVELSLASLDGELALDFKTEGTSSWRITSRTAPIEVMQRPGGSAPLWLQGHDDVGDGVTVTPSAPGQLTVELPHALRATVDEDPDGTLRWNGKTPFARLRGRARCPTHDVGVAALVRVFVSTAAGRQILEDSHAIEPPPPRPRPRHR